jgi:hypothetical protein
MNCIDDPLRLVACLEPAILGQLAEEGYARSRAADMENAAQEGFARPRPVRGRPRTAAARSLRPYLLTGAVAATATAAAAIAMVAAGGPPGGRGQAPATPPAANEIQSAHSFLLASAVIASHAPATTGSYWYVSDRSWEPSVAVVGHPKNAVGLKKLKQPMKNMEQFGAVFAATEESWTGQSRARTIVNENLAFSFMSPAGEAKWIAAGRPPLETADGTNTKPATSNYAMTFRFGPGHGLTVDQMKRLPATPAALSRVLRKMWNSIPADPANPDSRQAVLGLPHPTFADYVGAWADAVLGGPTTPGTQAAMYRLLAEQPDVTIVRGVTDPLGRAGVAIGADGEYLIIDPQTAQLLASTTRPVYVGRAIPTANGGVDVIEAQGWTTRLGARP